MRPCSTLLSAHLSLGLLNLVLLTPICGAQQPPVANPDAEIVTSVPGQPAEHESPKHEADRHGAAESGTSSRRPSVSGAWSVLTEAAGQRKHADTRIQALAALGTLGPDTRAEKLISDGMNDTDLDVRTAAILAAGQSGNRNLTTDIRAKLDDKEPQVAFAAASTLWKLNDRSGEDILLAVVDGERSAAPGLMDGTRQNVIRELRNPAALARFGAMQGASMLLGPFGFGITALEYMRKNGGDAARINAIELIAQQRNGPIRSELVRALADKDPGVRAAAARALGSIHDISVAPDIATLFDDPKTPVRLTAAAAFINAHRPGPAPVRPPAKTSRRRS